MARRKISGDYSEPDTEDISTSLASDLTNSLDLSLSKEASDFEEGRPKKRSAGASKKVTKQLIERKQLLHDVQLLKIELSQKNQIITNLKAEHMSKLEELEEKLNDALHRKNILQAKLEAQLNLQRDEASRRQDKMNTDLEMIARRQLNLEKTNQELLQRAGNIRESMENLNLTEDEFIELKAKNDTELSLRDFVAIKFYENIHPLEVEVKDLREWNKSLEDQVDKWKQDVYKLQENLNAEHRERVHLETQSRKLTLELTDVKSSIQQGDYKKENYDRIRRERDELEQELMETKKQYAYVSAAHQAAAKQRDEIQKELSTVRQELNLLGQDKEYLSRQLSDLTSKYGFAEDKLSQASIEVERIKKAREELYEKYVESRDRFKAEYESKLRRELDEIRLRTDAEVDKVKSSTKELFERENRNLREARDSAFQERERALEAQRESDTKFEDMLASYRKLQVESDTKTSDLQNELRLKTFDAERTQMLHEETLQNLKKTQLDCDKHQTKVEVLTKEFYGLQTSSERQIKELESEIAEKKSKLEIYEKLEQELDDVVMQAAEYDNEDEAERVLFSYGYGANVPTTSKRRLKQSVHLARRVLNLERINTSLRKELDQSKTKLSQLGNELSNATSLLDQAQQPYHYLIESIRTRDSQIDKHSEHISILEDDIRSLKQERNEINRTKNQLSADMERLLNQRQEVAVMKQIVLNLSKRRMADSGIQSKNTTRQSSPAVSPRSDHHRRHPLTSTARENASDNPLPTVFTKERTSQNFQSKPTPTSRRLPLH
ncbi:progesterone-induced-blocking factor 1-like [Anneissia japonica]|uniref:progesterone-induced-blocking factor 1-like n=1 Tax=Anneissia japonica TaxID=1529436 RepID=UPI0014255024|nr:progesterone-induced-blocking factor 1-like [Anneissia japonica]